MKTVALTEGHNVQPGNGSGANNQYDTKFAIP